ncbi:MAG: RNA-binding S4 domain-containing protein [Deltaproteobacteria bacterium]|nr:RNA-binding S4 domain-containing protein [Deltaproteobacteria bacterium]
METFEFSGDYIELNKLLKAYGLCGTGGMAKTVIENGLVSVDGTVEYRKRCKIRTGQSVEHGGRTINVVQVKRQTKCHPATTEITR